MKLVRVLLTLSTAALAYAANTTSTGISKCSLCTIVVKEAEGLISSQGCSLLFDAEAAALCQGIGLGPEDPISYLCVPLLVKGCSVIAKDIEQHVTDPKKTCATLRMC